MGHAKQKVNMNQDKPNQGRNKECKERKAITFYTSHDLRYFVH